MDECKPLHAGILLLIAGTYTPIMTVAQCPQTLAIVWCGLGPFIYLLVSMSALLVTLRSSKPMVYLQGDRNPVGLSANRPVGCLEWTVLIGRTGFDNMYSIPDPTLSLKGVPWWVIRFSTFGVPRG